MKATHESCVFLTTEQDDVVAHAPGPPRHANKVRI
jgi:hypothetical protein